MRRPTDRSATRPPNRRARVLRALPLVVLILAGAVSTGHAAPSGRDTADGSASRAVQWTLGDLAYGLPALDSRSSGFRITDSRLSDLNSKMRVGGFLLPGAESFATVRPWIGAGGGSAGRTNAGPTVAGGILVDVPLGSFVFTPSFGASLGPANRSHSLRDTGVATEFRSQLELGYVFDNKSRFTVGYSRIATDGNGTDSAMAANSVFGFYYRLPFGGP